MSIASTNLFKVPALGDVGTADTVFPLPIQGNPLSLASEAPSGVILMAVFLVQEPGIRVVVVRFHCPTGFATDIAKGHYTHATVKLRHLPEGKQFVWIKFGDSQEFKVVN